MGASRSFLHEHPIDKALQIYFSNTAIQRVHLTGGAKENFKTGLRGSLLRRKSFEDVFDALLAQVSGPATRDFQSKSVDFEQTFEIDWPGRISEAQ